MMPVDPANKITIQYRTGTIEVNIKLRTNKQRIIITFGIKDLFVLVAFTYLSVCMIWICKLIF